jgi:hypothetical protein
MRLSTGGPQIRNRVKVVSGIPAPPERHLTEGLPLSFLPWIGDERKSVFYFQTRAFVLAADSGEFYSCG